MQALIFKTDLANCLSDQKKVGRKAWMWAYNVGVDIHGKKPPSLSSSFKLKLRAFRAKLRAFRAKNEFLVCKFSANDS